jgi:hypothetical protein
VRAAAVLRKAGLRVQAVTSVLSARGAILQSVKHLPGRVAALATLSATRALYLGPEGSGGDVFRCSGNVGTGGSRVWTRRHA